MCQALAVVLIIYEDSPEATAYINNSHKYQCNNTTVLLQKQFLLLI